MIGIRDNLTLSLTKLKLRRVRLIVTLIVSGIIFTVLIFSSLVGRGITHSLESFSQEGLLNHYIIQVQDPAGLSYDYMQDPKVIARAEALDQIRLAAQTKEAKQLGVPFDPKTSPKAVSTPAPNQPKNLDLTSPAAIQAVTELRANNTRDKVTAAASPYHATAVYENVSLGATQVAPQFQFEITPVIGGKEQQQSKDMSGYGKRDSITNFQNELTPMSGGLLRPFLLDGTSLAAAPGDPIPILAPTDAAEQLLGLKALPKTATPADKIERLSKLRTEAKNLIFETCYRNSTAISLRDEAKQQAADIAAHTGDADYQKPSVIYGPPAAACQPTPIAKDTRTGDEKSADTKATQFKEDFGQPKALTTSVKFKIIGILPQPGSLTQAQGLESAFTSLLSTTLGEGWFVPLEAASQNTVIGPVINNPFLKATSPSPIYVDFPDRQSQKRFIEDKGCTLNATWPPNCPAGKFLIVPFGNPLAVAADAMPQLQKAGMIALGIIALLSAIIMSGTIGKVIADSRKETSVFRALGAKRLDIAQIYLLYTAFLATLAYLIALAIGAGAAIFLEAKYSADLSAQAVLAFNSHNLHKTFHIIGLSVTDLTLIYAFVIAIALVSSTIPLLGNIRRNPVKDMREE